MFQDKYFHKCVAQPTKEILGGKRCGKMKISHEFLDSPTLRTIEAAIATENSEDNMRVLIKNSQVEPQRLRKGKFDKFADEVSDLLAGDMPMCI